MHLTRKLKVLTPSCRCTQDGCLFASTGRLDALMEEVVAHVRESGHSVRVTEGSEVLYGLAETKAVRKAREKAARNA